MKPLLPTILLEKKPALWDGGMGSQLLAAGLKPGEAPETWNLERPGIVKAIHKAYYDAGADVVQTNTFGGNRARLAETGCPYSVQEICKAGAQIVIETRPEGRLVAGNIGPTGLSFPPVGTAVEEALFEIFAEQAGALADAGVDLLSVETMSDLREARAALGGARSVCDLPIVVSMTFRATRRGFFTIMGDLAGTSLETLLDDGAAAVGANCTLSSKAMAAMAVEIRKTINGPVIIQPNAGDPQIEKHGDTHTIRYAEGPVEFAANLHSAIAAGIQIIGGCCGTTPEHIAHLAVERNELHP
ncbi:MAG: homocysteine S-methyltransferase family protein [Deltaproteobacteria bacterium]|nr:homocysteine S-methyltransferase family protein [Deltaproteobacteria bacterium]